MTKIWIGPQGEPVEIRDVAVDGPGFGPTSAVAAGTDREQAITKFAASIVGPQGEILRPTCEEGICPLCQQAWPEVSSQPGEDLSAQPGATPDFDAIREDEEPVVISRKTKTGAPFDGASPNEFEMLA